MKGGALFWLAGLLGALAFATSPLSAKSDDGHFRAGVSDIPPYALKGPDGIWRGLAISMWEEVARKCGYTYEYVELPPEALISSLVTGDVDIVLGELAVDSEREQVIDFTHPYLMSYTGIAVPKRAEHFSWIESFRTLFNSTLLHVFLLICVGVVVISTVIWLFERRHNPDHFGTGLRGLGSAIWFAGVTMTTVGYGDKTPRTAFGRMIALFWMLVSLLIISAFTATVASSVTASHIERQFPDWATLRDRKTGVVEGSETADYLMQQRISVVPYLSMQQGLEALAAGKLEAFAGDDLPLSYYIDEQFSDSLRNLPSHLLHVQIAMGLQAGDPRRETINRAILSAMDSPNWQQILTEYLGSK